MNLLDKMKAFPTVQRDNCPRCGNPWYFERAEDYECTTCHVPFPKAEIEPNKSTTFDATRFLVKKP